SRVRRLHRIAYPRDPGLAAHLPCRGVVGGREVAPKLGTKRMPRLFAIAVSLLITPIALAGEPSGWILERRMVACCGAGSPTFAAAVAGGPPGVLVGVPNQGAGSAVLFDDETGGIVTRLEAPVASREFGRAVAVAQDALAVGAPDVASVFLFDARSGAIAATLRDPRATDQADEFGQAIAIGSTDVVVGAPFDDHDGRDAGAAWVFDRRSGGLRFALASPGAFPGARFGAAVAISGDDVVVGTSAEGAAGSPGRVTVYSLRTGAVRWTRTAPSSVDGRL